jgi:hypothetical protein
MIRIRMYTNRSWRTPQQVQCPFLENVVPFVLSFSIVGQYKDRCHTVQELLLQQFQYVDHDELCNCRNVLSLEHYIYNVNDRIEAVRDLLNRKTTTTPMRIVNSEVPMEQSRVCAAISPKLTPATHGTAMEENAMRSWLETPALPSNVGDVLVSLGIRTMNDVQMLSKLSDSQYRLYTQIGS